MNIQQAITLAKQQLQTESAQTDAEYLLSNLLSKSLTWLKTWSDYQLSTQQQASYRELLQRRQQGEPVAYITGERDFWTLTLQTNNSTLIPRPETELLVELSLDLLAEKTSAKVLDLGTGTGAIALAIASERPNDQLFACDFNRHAVELATANALKNSIHNVTFFQSDWYANLTQANFDLIVANPPYIAEQDPHLLQGDLRFEPSSALIAKDDGLADIKIIVEQAVNFLSPQGKLMLEHGYNQAEHVRQIMRCAGFTQIKSFVDLNAHERVTLASG